MKGDVYFNHSKGGTTMNLEQLQAMSDTELNELSAVKVMGYKVIKREGTPRYMKNAFAGSYITWNPTTDMNDAMELTKHIDDHYKQHFYIEALRKTQGWDSFLVGNNIMYHLINATARQRTIASILALE